MELLCESVRFTEDSMRPASSKLLELHVLFVPADQWDMKLNKVPAEATESFISAGFIRVYPETTLQTLRGELAALLGAERSIHKFSFLKCVGRSLALVKGKQETNLKVKTFAPPYAAQPELYLLPTGEADSTFCSQSFTMDSSSSSPEHQVCLHPSKMCSVATGTKKAIKFPHISQCSQQPVPVSVLEEEREDEEDESSCSSSSSEDEAPGFIRRTEPEICAGKPQNQRVLKLIALRKALEICEANSAHAVWSAETEEICRKTIYQPKDTHSGAAESLEDHSLGFLLTDSVGDSKCKGPDREKTTRNKPTNGMLEGPAMLPQPVQCTASPRGPDSASDKAVSASLDFLSNREALMEEIKMVREERKQLEWTRQQLLRKGKDLLAQNRHRRNQARDSWKKKYFETKKTTAPLEEHLRNLRQELELFHNKVLHQLQAREKARRQGRSSEKNELIIQIMKESYEVDNLKRKVDDAKMKLITEIKLRKQAATELRDLKTELSQKKNQSSPSWMDWKHNTGQSTSLKQLLHRRQEDCSS
ncbi:spermatogenesis-associated protein 1 isoform X1 [Xiphophorus hellerii]|uniref:spermatogenesis-associated protein 1 isoform X1 n=1 Tax=Xiphophorus hellerii TaxID=8084 RepID=UPI0013B41998|nr:spermatogenesis-associated protein 1 isoform X1 [Xiphophorus hellerii]